MALRSIARCLLLLLLVPASRLDAERPAWLDEPRPWHVLVGPSLTVPPFATSYVSHYSPPFPYVPHTSTATQTLPLEAEKGPGVWLGVERALGPHVGLQLSAHYGEADISGAPGQYDLSMRYTSRPPPSYEPVEVSLQRSERPPAAEGRLKTLAVAVDFVAWAEVGTHGRLGLSAGPAWLHTKGRAQSLIYTAYFLGGHSTAFHEDFLLSFEFPASALGLDGGAFAEVDFGRRVGLRLDVRYCWGPEQEAEVALVDIVNVDPTIRSIQLDEIERELAAVPVRLDPSSFRAALALTIRF